ncbi:hypothetical protein BU23DRAFT_292556 [Bimuria novae-zelandiae CBS 107.79]|uniref:Uncharacterized protein n=1 Tax=Bimuria novae-zelandiae CBS 107.79 TaxID=1447943 RepID=A0A6A5UQV2_9PLEO|nr:hypothetical protein BU23DRAFT_292556 [Bimuria novae-zelandiae CBS 107.79]
MDRQLSLLKRKDTIYVLLAMKAGERRVRGGQAMACRQEEGPSLGVKPGQRVPLQVTLQLGGGCWGPAGDCRSGSRTSTRTRRTRCSPLQSPDSCAHRLPLCVCCCSSLSRPSGPSSHDGCQRILAWSRGPARPTARRRLSLR